MRMTNAIRLIAYSRSPRCQMWYQRVIETDTTQSASTTVRHKPLSTSTASTAVQYTPVATSLSRDRQCVDDSPAQFRRVRLRCRDTVVNVKRGIWEIEYMDDIFIHVDGVAFSYYQVALLVAIHQVLSDEDLGSIISSLPGKVNRTPLPCQNIMRQIQYHSQERVRSIYMSVYVNRSFWRKEARRVYEAWTSLLRRRSLAYQLFLDD